jgi:membrane-associated phospholipid phosphatase
VLSSLSVPTASFILTVALSLQGSPAAEQPPQPWTDDRPLTRMAQNLTRDLVSVPALDTVTIAALGAMGAAVSRPSDHSIARWVDRAGQQRSYTPIGSLIGNEWLQGGAAIATYAIGRVQKSPELTHMGSDLIRAQVLNGVFTTTLKLAAPRDRPNGGGRSFPSGHSSATFASATVLGEHYGWKVGVPAYAVAGFIGWTRVRDREHWLSDVIFGSALGIVAGKTVTRGHMGRWTIAPMALNGGGGIYLVRR